MTNFKDRDPVRPPLSRAGQPLPFCRKSFCMCNADGGKSSCADLLLSLQALLLSLCLLSILHDARKTFDQGRFFPATARAEGNPGSVETRSRSALIRARERKICSRDCCPAAKPAGNDAMTRTVLGVPRSRLHLHRRQPRSDV